MEFGWKVRSAGTEPGGRVCGLGSGLLAMVLQISSRSGNRGWLGAGNSRLMVDDSFGMRVDEFGERRCTYLSGESWDSVVTDLGTDGVLGLRSSKAEVSY